MKKGKYIKLLIVLAVLIPWCPADANFINVISQEYVISGSGFFYGFPDVPPGKSYNISSVISPLSESVYDSFFAGAYSASSSSDGGVTETYAWTHISAEANDEGNAYSTASSLASMIFSPILSSLMTFRIDYHGHEAAQYYVRLLDLTSNTSLLPSADDPFWNAPYDGGRTLTLSFDPTHLYYMGIEAEQVNFFRLEYSSYLTAVPEPNSILFLCVGLLVIAGTWKKLKKP